MGRAQVGRKETAVTGANAFMTHASARQPAGQYAQKRGANAKMAPLSCPSVTRHPSPVTRQFSCQTVCWPSAVPRVQHPGRSGDCAVRLVSTWTRDQRGDECVHNTLGADLAGSQSHWPPAGHTQRLILATASAIDSMPSAMRIDACRASASTMAMRPCFTASMRFVTESDFRNASFFS